jgi:beta-lactamase regulating signal transducer with metallopeptidase domain
LNLPPDFHWLAAVALERLLYCLTGGIALGAVIWMVLRLLPGKNSRTRFAVWFSTLVAVALMPLMAFESPLRSLLPGGSAPSHALIAIPVSWAEYIVLAWGAMAMIGVARVLAGIWQLRRLRRDLGQGCVLFEVGGLSGAAQARIAEVSRRRGVSILVSPEVQVPTAIGFFNPAIVIPAWLPEESAGTELECVLLHELAHLEHWDDWSNLVQKLIKAVLFFHPAVWWMERKLSLDREMACDDAVLAQTPNPRVYAECLARVAEKRFLRRQIALAQAAVDRVKQLSSRVARILSSDGNHSTRLWKPAIPMVVGVAAICGVSTFRTTELVRVTERQSAKPPAVSSTLQIPLLKSGGADQMVSAENSAATPTVVPARATDRTQVRAWPASLELNSNSTRKSLLRVHHRVKSKPSPTLRSANQTEPVEIAPDPATLLMLATFAPPPARENEEAPAGAIFVVTATQRIIPTSSGTVQFSTWELRLVVPAEHPVKPIPRKT